MLAYGSESQGLLKIASSFFGLRIILPDLVVWVALEVSGLVLGEPLLWYWFIAYDHCLCW